MTALEIFGELSPCLKKSGFQFWVGGSVASSIWGDPRQTNDIDLAVLRSTVDEERLRANLPENYYVSTNEVADALADPGEYASFQILNMEEAFKFDVFVVREDEYTLAERNRVRHTEVLPGVVVPLASPEDIVLHKIRWFELGGGVSDRQWNDIVRVLEIQHPQLDLPYLQHWANHFRVSDQLTRALSQVRA